MQPTPTTSHAIPLNADALAKVKAACGPLTPVRDGVFAAGHKNFGPLRLVPDEGDADLWFPVSDHRQAHAAA